MRVKVEQKMDSIVDCMNWFGKQGIVPSIRDIADKTGISKSMVHEYLKDMNDKNIVRYDEESGQYFSREMDKMNKDNATLPMMGAISCGPPEEAGDGNISDYYELPRSFVGKGDFYMLTASGDSMEDIGISSGDVVIIRKQREAKDGDIVVARVEGTNDFTLKRFKSGNNGTYLHPENKNMENMFFKEIEVFGVATKVIKNLV